MPTTQDLSSLIAVYNATAIAASEASDAVRAAELALTKARATETAAVAARQAITSVLSALVDGVAS